MSNHAKLSARVRPEAGTNPVKAVRARDSVPAVIYGSSVQPQNLEVNRREFEILLSHAAGESILIDLTVEENGKSANHLALVQEVQHHPLRGDVLHIDFHAVSANETIEASIPIEPTGEADGVKNFGGILEIVLRELSISCLPKDLPEVLHVDVSGLKVGDAIHVRDLPLPKGVESTLDGEITVLSIAPPNVATDTPAAEATAAPEVLKEKKAAE
jgi:large subunit ribosomal protein L25